MNERTVKDQRVWRSRRRWLFIAVYTLFLLLVAEIGSRALWKARGAGFFAAPRQIHRSFYPQVAEAERTCAAQGEPGRFDVLMLGGSVLAPKYGDIEHLLRERLSRALQRRVRIFNLSAAAHTSLDSYYKYKHLDNCHFDLVLLYHGINELRANNCPAEIFHNDYGHLSWYRLINDYERSADRWLATPYTIKFVCLKLAGRMGWTSSLPTHEPGPESTRHGCDVKTVAPFKDNLIGILDLARTRGQPVVLMTFASHIPDDYSKERFLAADLDYTTHLHPVELWGRPDCVGAGIHLHNRVVEELAHRGEAAAYVAQHELIPAGSRTFNDVCHLTHEGCERFVENLVPAILNLVD